MGAPLRGWKILGVVACGLVVLLSVGIGVLLYKGFQLNAEGAAFVDAAIPAISAQWSEAELLDRATPEMKQDKASLTKLFDALRQLGKLTKYNGATGNTDSSFDSETGTTITGNYTATGDYQNGTATFEVVTVKRDGHWMINGFWFKGTLTPDAGTGKSG